MRFGAASPCHLLRSEAPAAPPLLILCLYLCLVCGLARSTPGQTTLSAAKADRASTIHPEGFPGKSTEEVEALKDESFQQVNGDGAWCIIVEPRPCMPARPCCR
jgi:hypothetical protein